MYIILRSSFKVCDILMLYVQDFPLIWFSMYTLGHHERYPSYHALQQSVWGRCQLASMEVWWTWTIWMAIDSLDWVLFNLPQNCKIANLRIFASWSCSNSKLCKGNIHAVLKWLKCTSFFKSVRQFWWKFGFLKSYQ